MQESRKIGIVGAGWVGLVTGGCFAELGHNVIVRDIVEERIESLRAGRMPFHEPNLPEMLEKNRERLRYTTAAEELGEADVLFICVQTPPTYSGDADLSYVWNALDDLPRSERRQILVMKSTVRPWRRAICRTSATHRTPSSSPRATPSATSSIRTGS